MLQSSVQQASRVSRPGDKVSLNPQPLPPRELVKRALNGSSAASQKLAERGIIIVSGKAGQASLNPQPLPPRVGLAKQALNATTAAAPQNTGHASDRGIIVVGGKAGQVSLNPQPLPPRDLFSRVRETLNSASPYTPSLGSDRGIIVVGG